MNFRKALQIFLLVIEAFPAVLSMVRAAEQQIPGAGKGKQKLDLVLTWLEESYTLIKDIAVPFDEVKPRFIAMIDKAVAVFNEAGEFEKEK